MTLTVKHLKDQTFSKPMVIFPLKQYENLLEYIEDLEDRLAINDRMNEPVVSQEEVNVLFKKKFD